MTLSELVRRVGNLVNVVLTYRRGDVQQFIEEAMEADHPIWTDGIDPIDVQPAGSPPLFPDAVVHSRDRAAVRHPPQGMDRIRVEGHNRTEGCQNQR